RPRLTLFKPQLQASRLTHGTAAFPLANPPRRVLRLGDTLSRFINIYGQNTRQDQVVTTGSRHDPAGWDRCSHIFSVNHDRHKDYGHPGPLELIPLQDVKTCDARAHTLPLRGGPTHSAEGIDYAYTPGVRAPRSPAPTGRHGPPGGEG